MWTRKKCRLFAPDRSCVFERFPDICKATLGWHDLSIALLCTTRAVGQFAGVNLSYQHQPLDTQNTQQQLNLLATSASCNYSLSASYSILLSVWTAMAHAKEPAFTEELKAMRMRCFTPQSEPMRFKVSLQRGPLREAAAATRGTRHTTP